MSTVIPECGADEDPDVMLEALNEAGCLPALPRTPVESQGGWRDGIVVIDTLDWLRREENQHLSMPFAYARALPQAVRNRLGFGMDYGSGGLGLYDASFLLRAVRRSEVVASPFE